MDKARALPVTMQAMVMEKQGQALVLRTLPLPLPSARQVLVKIIACGLCHTDVYIMDGQLPNPKLPLIPGHEIIGTVVRTGEAVAGLKPGDLVGIPWLGFTCGYCRYCLKEQENLCENALFTGYTMNGGYAEYTVAFENFCFPMAPRFASAASAPLLCAGLIGYRCYSMIGPHVEKLGIYGFGAAAHILIQVALFQHKQVYAFTRDGDRVTQDFAKRLGATWAGSSLEAPPELLDAAIIFAGDGTLVPQALKATDKGGTIVCGEIHMSDIPAFAYQLLWEERILRSVANLTRKDGKEFLALADVAAIKTETQFFPLAQANEALTALRKGQIHGASVLVMDLYLSDAR
jgi:propanol-preferring alcohol dehydrogenase